MQWSGEAWDPALANATTLSQLHLEDTVVAGVDLTNTTLVHVSGQGVQLRVSGTRVANTSLCRAFHASEGAALVVDSSVLEDLSASAGCQANASWAVGAADASLEVHGSSFSGIKTTRWGASPVQVPALAALVGQLSLRCASSMPCCTVTPD